MWTYLLDGEDITELADDKAWTRRTSRPSSATVKLQSHLLGDIGVVDGVSVLTVIDDTDTPRFQGRLWDSEDDGDENTVYTELKFQDPMVMWPKKIARDADGDFSLPTFFQDFPQGPEMMFQIIENSIAFEGPLDLVVGTVATGGPDLNARPADFPMSLDDIRTLLLQTGYLDVVINPILDSVGVLGEVNLYNGDYGTDRTGDISIDYGIGLYNARRIKRTFSMQDVCNKLWYYLGPRCVEIDEQHWRGNVTGDDPGLVYPPGGDKDIVAGNNPLGQLRRDSIADYGELMEIRIYDDFGGDCDPNDFDGTGPFTGTNNDFRPFYQRMWQNETLLRARPRELISWTPVRGFWPDPFDAGDLVTVQAGTRVRGAGFSGTQRVYEFTVGVDKAGVPSMDDIVTSADQES